MAHAGERIIIFCVERAFAFLLKEGLELGLAFGFVLEHELELEHEHVDGVGVLVFTFGKLVRT